MAFDPNELNSENTPMRWRIQGKRLAEGGVEGAAEAAKLGPVYRDVLEKAAVFTSDTELGVGNQAGVGSEPDPVLVSSITITGAVDLDVNDGNGNVNGDPQTCNLDVVVSPSDAEDQSVKFSSSDKSIATVSPVYGLVTAVSAGTVTITATANDGSGVTGTVDITVADTTADNT